MRPKYHISPPHGFLNDPNGLAQFQGKYHAFYQWLPAVVPRGKKCWRHCVSDDLVHWTDEGCTLEPVEWYEKDGCYSGSGIVAGGRYYLFYTGNVRDEEGGRESYQCAAVSDDGRTFVKKGPVVHRPEAYTPHFRDPKVWEKDGRWWMLAGAQTRDLAGKFWKSASGRYAHRLRNSTASCPRNPCSSTLSKWAGTMSRKKIMKPFSAVWMK